MHALLIALLLGVAYANGPAQLSQLDGAWRTWGILSDNPPKIEAGGPLRLLLRDLQVSADGRTITATFYVRENGACQLYTVPGVLDPQTGAYVADYSGINYYGIFWMDENVVVFYVENLDQDGQPTRMMLLAGRGPRPQGCPTQKLRELAEVKGLRYSTIECIAGPDGCPDY